MVKKTITYKDYDGESRTEDFYFNLNKAEIIRMNYSTEENFAKLMQKMIDEKNMHELYKLFEQVIQMSYGKKSAGGRNFVKSQEILEDFMSTEAYSELIMWLIKDADNASNFINGILPEPEENAENAEKKEAPATEPKAIPAVGTVE